MYNYSLLYNVCYEHDSLMMTRMKTSMHGWLGAYECEAEKRTEGGKAKLPSSKQICARTTIDVCNRTVYWRSKKSPPWLFTYSYANLEISS